MTSPRLQSLYEQAHLEAGFQLDDAKALQLHWTHVAATDDAAWSEAAPHFHHLLTVYREWIVESREPGDKGGEMTVPPVDELRSTPPVIFRPVFGGPETVAAMLNESIANVSTIHLAFGVLPGMDPRSTRASLELIVSDVAPRLR